MTDINNSIYKNSDYFAVIMAGGEGARFWPVSVSKFPKQYHDILGVGRTFIQQSYDRLAKVVPPENIYVITTKEYSALTVEQLPEMPKENIIAEPVGMNTAACNILTAYIIKQKNPNAKLIIAPSDHIVLNVEKFAEKLIIALEFADSKDALVTLGISPTRPDTGYGYIQFLENGNGPYIKKVKTFTEKPNKDLAESFLESGDFLWNAGIFIWSVENIIKAYESYLPEMFDTFEEIYEEQSPDIINQKIQQKYSTLQFISIDKGILEKADNVYVVPSSFGWSDLGTWNSVYEFSEKDENHNVIKGNHILTYDSTGNIIQSINNKAIIAVDLHDYIVINTEKALLICPLEKDQEVKKYISDLKFNKGEDFV